MNPADLERLVAGSLRELPPPVAPGTLLPRVMAAVQQWAQRPWYAREWLTWPRQWQLLSAVAVLALLATAIWGLPFAETWTMRTAASLARATVADPVAVKSVVDDTAQRASVTTNAVWIVWRVVVSPFVAYAAAIVTLMCLACALLAAALNHLAFGKAISR